MGYFGQEKISHQINPKLIFPFRWFLSIALHTLYCTQKSHYQANEPVHISRTCPVLFSINSPSKGAQWSLAIEWAQWPFFFIESD